MGRGGIVLQKGQMSATFALGVFFRRNVAVAVFAVMFLARWFRTRTLMPFAIYSLIFGLASVIRFGLW